MFENYGTTARRLAATAWVMASLACAGSALGQQENKPAATPAPAPIRVTSSDIHDREMALPVVGEPAIEIVCPRNGAASGKVLVSSEAPIQGLKATVGELRPSGASGAAIPAANVQVRCAVSWDGGVAGAWGGVPGADILLEAPLPVFPPTDKGKYIVPVWVTVRVPKDARPGAYAATLTIESKGGKPETVPVKVSVQDWTLPDSQDYRVWVELVQQPDTLVGEYRIAPWSDKHWELIAKSLRLIRDTGSRVVYAPLIAGTNYGNSQTMVRWVRGADGTYQHDFSLLEKYLDAVQENLGRPKLVIFNVWEVYLSQARVASQPVEVEGREGSYEWRESSFAKALQELQGKGPPVTVIGAGGREANSLRLPRWDDPSAKALWRPVFDGIRQRMKARGLENAMMLGVVSDRQPTKAEVAALDELSGSLPWTSCSHHASWLTNKEAPRQTLQGIGTIGYTAVALDFQYVLNPAKDRYYGWRKPMLHAQYWRFGYFNSQSLPTIRTEAECHITGNQRGLAHIGADFWPCYKNNSGKRTGTVTDRYPESYWHSLNIGAYLLAPGPDGPVGTARLEVFREGIQECEARIAIESALLDPAAKERLGAELARRAQEVLDERQIANWKGRGATDEQVAKYGLVAQYRDYYEMTKGWDKATAAANKAFITGGWAQRAAKLFAVAAEVQKKAGK